MLNTRILFVATALTLGMLACSRDPKVLGNKHLHKAKKYLDKAEYAAARIELTRATEADPSSFEAFYQLALASEKVRDWRDAYLAITRATNLDPKNTDAELVKTELEFARGDYDRAHDSAEAAVATNHNDPRPLLLLGKIAVAKKNLPDALEDFERASSIAPTNAEAFTSQASVLRLMNRGSEAEAQYRKAIAVDPKYYAAYLALAELYSFQQKSEAEIEVLELARAVEPKMIPAYMLCAREYQKRGQSERVDAIFSELRKQVGDTDQSLLAIAGFYEMTGNAVRSKDLLRNAIARNPKLTGVRRALIDIYLDDHLWNDAQELNGVVLQQSPKDTHARLSEARILIGNGRASEATPVLEQLVRDDPTMADAKLVLGIAYKTLGMNQHAAVVISEAVKQDPRLVNGYVILSGILLENGDSKLALSDADDAISRAPWLVAAHVARINALLQINDIPAASREAESFARRSPQNAELEERLGYILLRQQQFNEARQHLEEALKLRKDFLPALNDLLETYYLQKHPELGIARVKSQIEIAPDQAGFDELLGLAQWTSGDQAAAEKSFLSSTKKDPTRYSAYLKLSELYGSQKRLSDSIIEAEQAKKIRPNAVAAYLLLGTLYETSGDIDKARTEYQAALTHDADSAVALNNLAWLDCEHGGNLDVALGLAQKAKQNAPTSPGITDTLGWIEYKKGLYGAATEAFRMALKGNPNSGTYYYHLGMSLWKSGSNQEARTALEKALALHLPGKEADEAHEALENLGRSST